MNPCNDAVQLQQLQLLIHSPHQVSVWRLDPEGLQELIVMTRSSPEHRKEIFGNGSSRVFGELLISFYISCSGGNQLDDAAFILYGGHA